MWLALLALVMADAIAQQWPDDSGPGVLCVYRTAEDRPYFVTVEVDDLHFVTLAHHQYACAGVPAGFHQVLVLASQSPFAAERQEWRDAISLEARESFHLDIGFPGDGALQVARIGPGRVRTGKEKANEAPRESMGVWAIPVQTDSDGTPVFPPDPTLPAEAAPAPGPRP